MLALERLGMPARQVWPEQLSLRPTTHVHAPLQPPVCRCSKQRRRGRQSAGVTLGSRREHASELSCLAAPPRDAASTLRRAATWPLQGTLARCTPTHVFFVPSYFSSTECLIMMHV